MTIKHFVAVLCYLCVVGGFISSVSLTIYKKRGTCHCTILIITVIFVDDVMFVAGQ